MHLKVLSNIRNLHDSEFHCNVLQGNCPYCSAVDSMYVFTGNLQQHWTYCIACETGAIPKEKLKPPVDNLPVRVYKTTRYFMKHLLLDPDKLDRYISSAHAVLYRLHIAPNVIGCPTYNYVYGSIMGLFPCNPLKAIMIKSNFANASALESTETPVAVFPVGSLPGKVEGLFVVSDKAGTLVRHRYISEDDINPLIYLKFTGSAGTCLCDSISQGAEYIMNNLDSNENVICAAKL